MKIKLKLGEMFALGKLIEIQDVIGYKAALTKLFHEMLNDENFAEISDLNEKSQIVANEVNKERMQERTEMINKIRPYQNDPNSIPKEIQEELNNFNNELFVEIEKRNKQYITKIDEITKNDDREREFEFNKLTVSAIKNIIESEKKIAELGLNEMIVQLLINVYIKITSQTNEN